METYAVPAAIFAALIGLVEIVKILVRQLGEKKNGNGSGKDLIRTVDDLRRVTGKIEDMIEAMDRKHDIGSERAAAWQDRIIQLCRDQALNIRELSNLVRGENTNPRGSIHGGFDNE